MAWMAMMPIITRWHGCAKASSFIVERLFSCVIIIPTDNNTEQKRAVRHGLTVQDEKEFYP
jgi:hypothetical protein